MEVDFKSEIALFLLNKDISKLAIMFSLESYDFFMISISSESKKSSIEKHSF